MIFKSPYRLIGVVIIVSVATIMGCGESSDTDSSSGSTAGEKSTDYRNQFFDSRECTSWFKMHGVDNRYRQCASEICTYTACLHSACYANKSRLYCIESEAEAAMMTSCINYNHVMQKCMEDNW